jgi:hypothetical protein
MNLRKIIKFTVFGISTILFKRKKAILGTIIVTDRCNLMCSKHRVTNVLLWKTGKNTFAADVLMSRAYAKNAVTFSLPNIH